MRAERSHTSGKGRSAIAKRRRRNIAQEPEMEELKHVYGTMSDKEKQRTVDYLKREGAEEKKKGG